MKRPQSGLRQASPLRPGLTGSSVMSRLNRVYTFQVVLARSKIWAGVGVGQQCSCPPALRLARRHAGQHCHSGRAPCGYRAKAAAVGVGHGHALPPGQPAWVTCAARGPPGSPAQLPPPATASSANQTTLSLTGDKNCLAVTCTAPARESLPVNCALPNRVPPLKDLFKSGSVT
jgi:hypothetical protein